MPARSGASSGAVVDVVGLKDFRRALKAMDPEWPKALKGVHAGIGAEGAIRSRAVARGMGGVQAKAASAIGFKATVREARIAIYPSAHSDAMANVAFWGAKKRTGWYARNRYGDSATPQHPRWVGNSWDVAEAGQGPYAINAALASYKPDIWEAYFQMVLDLAHDAFNG